MSGSMNFLRTIVYHSCSPPIFNGRYEKYLSMYEIDASQLGNKCVCVHFPWNNLTRYTTTPNYSNTNNKFQKYSANTQIKRNHLIAFKYP